MSETIRISDLAAPRYTELQQSIRDYGETLSVTLNAQEILAEASEALVTGVLRTFANVSNCCAVSGAVTAA